MNRLRLLGLVSLSALSLALAGSTVSDRWPAQWHVNGNGVTGTLEISIGETGTLTGQLFGEAVEGYVSGRHVVIRRAGSLDDRSEVWEGWFGQPAGDSSDLIVAGKITISEGDRTQVYPWFGTQQATPSEDRVTASSSEEEVVAAPVLADAPVEAAPTRPGVSGHWTATEGKVEIIQDGNQLTAVLPDGSSHAGRMTGGDTLIIGLRKGCCNGKLEGPDVISWSDGSRWRRAD